MQPLLCHCLSHDLFLSCCVSLLLCFFPAVSLSCCVSLLPCLSSAVSLSCRVSPWHVLHSCNNSFLLNLHCLTLIWPLSCHCLSHDLSLSCRVSLLPSLFCRVSLLQRLSLARFAFVCLSVSFQPVASAACLIPTSKVRKTETFFQNVTFVLVTDVVWVHCYKSKGHFCKQLEKKQNAKKLPNPCPENTCPVFPYPSRENSHAKTLAQ
jgi:hypothetical protein